MFSSVCLRMPVVEVVIAWKCKALPSSQYDMNDNLDDKIVILAFCLRSLSNSVKSLNNFLCQHHIEFSYCHTEDRSKAEFFCAV